jgi:molybdenum cofactor biosynthesis protein B
MPEIDKSRTFVPVNIAILTVSDTRTKGDDRSGDVLDQRAKTDGHVVVDRIIVKDEIDLIIEQLNKWIKNSDIDVVISTGGTGVTGRDVTPEAFQAVFEKEITGFGELFRWISYKKIGTSTMQSRAVAGVTKGTYLFALPGSTGACKDAWDEILHNQLDIRYRPCNFVEIMPRLREHELFGRSS